MFEVAHSCKVQFSTFDSACSQNPEDCGPVTCIVKVQKIIKLLFVAYQKWEKRVSFKSVCKLPEL